MRPREVTRPGAPAAQQGSRPGARVAPSQEWPSGLCGSPATCTSLPHPAQPSRVTQESLCLRPLGADGPMGLLPAGPGFSSSCSADPTALRPASPNQPVSQRPGGRRGLSAAARLRGGVHQAPGPLGNHPTPSVAACGALTSGLGEQSQGQRGNRPPGSAGQ